MKQQSFAALLLLFGAGPINFALAGGKTGACTAPTGQISVLPSQVCNGTQAVAVGKDLTLKAVSLADKDCYCGRGVQDTIDTTTGVKWTVGRPDGTLTGGDTGTPKTWTAPVTTHTEIAVRLYVDDKDPDDTTTNDGDFTEVASLEVDVVIPNKNTPSTTDKTCPAGTFGYWKSVKDKLSRNGCTVDFKDLQFQENHCKRTSDGCNYGPTNNGGSAGVLGSDGSSTTHVDNIKWCDTNANWTKSNCTSISECYWDVNAPAGGAADWHQVFTREITYTMGASTAMNSISVSHTVKSYP